MLIDLVEDEHTKRITYIQFEAKSAGEELFLTALYNALEKDDGCIKACINDRATVWYPNVGEVDMPEDVDEDTV